MLNKIIQHNVLDPWPIEDESINCIITSPPYWNLRDYGNDSQTGTEATAEQYIYNMLRWSREATRVLKPEGTMWLNLGDCYHNITTITKPLKSLRFMM